MSNEIIQSIYTNQKLINYAKKRCYSLWEDLMSEIAITLYEMDKDKLTSLHNNKELESYCCKIIYLSSTSVNSPFYIKYIKPLPYVIQDKSEYDTEIDIMYNKSTGAIEWITTETEKTRPAIERKIFDLYLELGSYRKVGKEVNVPYKTIEYIVNKMRNRIKDHI